MAFKKTIFQSGTQVTSTFLNAIQTLKFNKNPTEEIKDGEYYRLGNDSLLNEPGNIRFDYYNQDNQLSVTEKSGLVVTVKGGRYVGSDSRPIGIQTADVGLTDNALNYVFINENNVIEAGLEIPYISLPLARVSTSNGSITEIYNARTRNKVFIRPNITKVFGGTGSQGDLITSQGYRFVQGVMYLSSLTIPAGINTIVDKYTKIYVSGDVQINGSIKIDLASPGGIGLQTQTIGGLNYGFFQGSGIGSTRSLPQNIYHWGSSPIGSGGSSGVVTAVNSDRGGDTVIASGGHGAGGLYIEAAGKIIVNGTITANGSNGNNATALGSNCLSTGGGGGSGGSIVLASNKRITIGSLAVLQANGGKGGKGAVGSGVSSAIAGGGGGGGAGHIELFSDSFNISSTATIELRGGKQGNTSNNDTDRSSGIVVGGGYGGSFGTNGGNGSNSSDISDNDGKDGEHRLREFVPVA